MRLAACRKWVSSHAFRRFRSVCLQRCAHVDCGIVDVGTPRQRVELDLVVDNLRSSIGRGHQVEALHLVSTDAEASGNPVPHDLGAVVDDVEGGDARDRWCVDNILKIKLFAGECDGAELD